MCSCSQEKGAKLRDAKGHEMEVDGSFVHCLLCGRYRCHISASCGSQLSCFGKCGTAPTPGLIDSLEVSRGLGRKKKKKYICIYNRKKPGFLQRLSIFSPIACNTFRVSYCCVREMKNISFEECLNVTSLKWTRRLSKAAKFSEFSQFCQFYQFSLY